MHNQKEENWCSPSDLFSMDSFSTFVKVDHKDVISPLCIQLNHDHSGLAIGHEDGYLVCTVPSAVAANATEPPTRTSVEGEGASKLAFAIVFSFPAGREPIVASEAHGVGVIAPLGRTHTVVLSGGGRRPMTPPNEARIMMNGALLRSIAIGTAIRRLNFLGCWIVGLAETEFFAVSAGSGGGSAESECAEAKSSGKIFFRAIGGSAQEPPGPMALCAATERVAIGVPPDTAAFQRKMRHAALEKGAQGIALVLHCGAREATVLRRIPAHSTRLTAVSLHRDRVATASARGTLVRIWSVANGQKLLELRVGTSQAVVRHLSMHGHGKYVACLCGNRLWVGNLEGIASTLEDAIGGCNSPATIGANPNTARNSYFDPPPMAQNQPSRWSGLQLVLDSAGAAWAVCAVEIPQRYFLVGSREEEATEETPTMLWSFVSSSISRAVLAFTGRWPENSSPRHPRYCSVSESLAMWWERWEPPQSAATMAGMTAADRAALVKDFVVLCSREGVRGTFVFDAVAGTIRLSSVVGSEASRCEKSA